MSQLDILLKKIEDRTFTVGIIGLGYVGLPLMWTFHQNDMPVIGYDIDTKKVENLKNGVPYIKHLGTEMMETLAKSDIADATTDFSRLDEADAILLCVPTPLDHHREPDMSYVEQTTETVSKHMRKGQLVILESTTWPGTTEELMIPILEKNSGLKAGREFYVAYSPEREDSGNPNFNTAKIPKVVGGHGEEALKLALAMYDTSIVETVPVSDCKTAEAVKLTENIFRSVNIALVNELKAKGAEVSYYDPFIPEVLPTREHADWTGTKSIEWDKETVSDFDAVLISTNHSSIDYPELAEWSDCVVDTRNAMAGIKAKNENHIFKAKECLGVEMFISLARAQSKRLNG